MMEDKPNDKRAQQNAREPLPADNSAPGAWDGPFTVRQEGLICWWDIERNLADARKRLHHTAPPPQQED